MRRRRFGALLGGAALFVVAGLAVGLGASSNADRTLRLVASTRRATSWGLEVVEAELRQGDTARGRLVAIYADLDSIRPELELSSSLAPVEDHLDGGAFAVANAGYFTREHRPTGLLAADGVILHPFVRQAGGAGSGVLMVEAGRVELIDRDRVGDRDFRRAELAIQAGPRVIEDDGSPGIRSDDGMRANRTVIGRDGSGRLVLAVVHAADAGLGLGPTLFELQRLLGPSGLGGIDPKLELTAALNLDGGPSTGLHLRPPAPVVDLPASSRVLSVVALEKRTP